MTPIQNLIPERNPLWVYSGPNKNKGLQLPLLCIIDCLCSLYTLRFLKFEDIR